MRPAGSLADEYAYATECQLTTLEGLCAKKSSPKSSLRRHTTIALTMLKVCQEHDSEITWGRGPLMFFRRVREVLDAAKGSTLRKALGDWGAKL